MEKEKVISYLDRFNYSYSEINGRVMVALGFGLMVEIDLSVEGKVLISDRLLGMNFLTFPFGMSIRSSMVLNSVSLLLLMVVFMFFVEAYNPSYLLLILICGCAFMLLWLIYYLVKAESFRRQIISVLR